LKKQKILFNKLRKPWMKSTNKNKLYWAKEIATFQEDMKLFTVLGAK
jgi:hypothetical protein